MTPLRRRMIQDMQLRNFAPPRTITVNVNVNVNCAACFTKHFAQSPQLLGPDDVRAYLHHLIEPGRLRRVFDDAPSAWACFGCRGRRRSGGVVCLRGLDTPYPAGSAPDTPSEGHRAG